MTRIEIPAAELHFIFSRSGGPGGQNVNRRETRVQLSFDVPGSVALTNGQKSTILAHPAVHHLLTDAGVILLAVDTHRSQGANIEAAKERLQGLLDRALAPRKKRRATKPTRGSKERRLDEKKRRSQTKASRRNTQD
ncbi:MAG: alternative ribosome rescue aminoacyl-tRNA hydrolase ArfB [Gemmataceae bacterium]